jgi:hypothetical protein
MNIKKLKEIFSENLPDDITEHLVIKVLSEDESVIEDILKIISAERKQKKILIREMNFQLSRAHLGLEASKFAKKGLNGDRFIEKEIEGFYHHFKGQVGHLYKKLEEMKPKEKQDKGFYQDDY